MSFMNFSEKSFVTYIGISKSQQYIANILLSQYQYSEYFFWQMTQILAILVQGSLIIAVHANILLGLLNGNALHMIIMTKK